ncbi:MAG: sialidase family protein, partial [Thermoanaerobaculia bacterium]|nr:sialidase family protein [Thermoanaerobaculia bacterium]
VAVSTDGGRTWTKHEAPGERIWDATDPEAVPRWVEPIAWDAAGALYSLWSEGSRVRLARSLDQGETWAFWTVLEESAAAYFPYMVAHGAGELAASWFVGSGVDLAVRVVAIEVPEDADAELAVRRAAPFQIDAWNEVKGDDPGRTPAGEYVPVVFLDEGRLGVASSIQDLRRDRWGFTWWSLVD